MTPAPHRLTPLAGCFFFTACGGESGEASEGHWGKEGDDPRGGSQAGDGGLDLSVGCGMGRSMR